MLRLESLQNLHGCHLWCVECVFTFLHNSHTRVNECAVFLYIYVMYLPESVMTYQLLDTTLHYILGV